MKDLSYINQNGDTVFTSKYYRNRGTCCKSGCLHCPYGFTLKKFGIDIKVIDDEYFSEAKMIFDSFFKKDTVTTSLLASAFGQKEVKVFKKERFRIMSLKGFICGILELKGETLEGLYLKDEFSDQGITDSDVLSALEAMN